MKDKKIAFIILPVDEEGNIYEHGFTSMDDFKVCRISGSLMKDKIKVIDKHMGKIKESCVDSLKVYFEDKL